MPEQRTRIVAGCMTGTSLDGLDVALVKIIGTGLDMKAELLGHHAMPMPDELRTTLMSLASGQANEPIVYMRAARALGELHAEGLEQLFKQVPETTYDFITAHGQTIWHAPRDGKYELGGGSKSWQLFDPWPIVKRFNKPVCYDLRQADLIAGGEGAPLTPISDWVMYSNQASVVINLGGIANFTFLANGLDCLNAGDLCGCNLILDGLCQQLVGRAYDLDGKLALSGTHDPDIYSVFSQAINKTQKIDSNRKNLSLGREQYRGPWLTQLLAHAEPKGPVQDVLRNAVMCIANLISSPIYRLDEGTWSDGHVHTVVLAGGGARNRALVEEMRSCASEPEQYMNYQYRVVLSDDLGIPCEAREAMGFAVLGALSQDGVPISLPQVTGATDPGVAGVWAGV